MAQCNQCGDVMHNDDMAEHECDPERIPEKGKPNKFPGRGKNLVAESPDGTLHEIKVDNLGERSSSKVS